MRGCLDDIRRGRAGDHESQQLGGSVLLRNSYVRSGRVHRHAKVRTCAAIVGAATVVATGAFSAGSGVAAAAPPKGGSLTIITQNNVFLSLDPSNNQFASEGQGFFNAVFDNLFYEQPNGSIAKGLVTSDKFTNDNKTFTFSIKKGLKFTDGTPFNAAAVAFNINRDIKAGCITYGTCDGIFKNVTSTKALSPYTVQMKMNAPSPTLVAAFVNTPPDWIGSPTAIKKEGNNGFGNKPVGLGAYEVQSFTSNAKVVLTKNPHYYKKGQPYLDTITFLNGSVDQSSYAALQSGSANIVAGITTPSIVEQAKKAGFHVKLVNNPIENFLEFNTFKPPFNNVVAREAVAYALDKNRMVELNSPGLAAVANDTLGPGAYGYEKNVPGSRQYNLTKAKALVQKLGGLSFTTLGGSTPSAELELTSLQSTLAPAGIKVTLKQASIAETKVALGSGKWMAQLGGLGGNDPIVGSFSYLNYLKSTGVYSCCRDPKLDKMIGQLSLLPDGKSRLNVIGKINQYVIAKNQYIVPMYSAPFTVLYDNSVHGLTTAPGVLPTIITMPLNTMWVSKA